MIYFFSFRSLLSQIAERKRGETLLSKILEYLPVGVWIIGEDGQIIYGNEASKKLWAGARYVGMDQYGDCLEQWHEIIGYRHGWRFVAITCNKELCDADAWRARRLVGRFQLPGK